MIAIVVMGLIIFMPGLGAAQIHRGHQPWPVLGFQVKQGKGGVALGIETLQKKPPQVGPFGLNGIAFGPGQRAGFQLPPGGLQMTGQSRRLFGLEMEFVKPPDRDQRVHRPWRRLRNVKLVFHAVGFACSSHCTLRAMMFSSTSIRSPMRSPPVSMGLFQLTSKSLRLMRV